ncbi:MAG: hypothetical protein I8H77_05915 [Comamonadaceae bacterium]|nr:hypothetical protein [Comamonadaceae bacterium]
MHIKRLLLLFFTLVLATSNVWPQEHLPLRGVIESASYDPANKEVSVRGWVLMSASGDLPALKMYLRDRAMQVQTISWIERGDVSLASPTTAEWIGRGFSFNVMLERELAIGSHAMRVSAEFSDGTEFDLPGLSGQGSRLKVEGVLTRHIWLAAIVFVVMVLIGALATRFHDRPSPAWLSGRNVHIVIISGFVALVLAGITGSSFGVMLTDPFSRELWSVEAGSGRIFKLRGIRGDEGRVLMPNVLAQLHHEPRFPVVNRNIGPEGQNMGVIGMTGVPVAQWAALARPATWGYFFLPLRQAMAWQWQMPIWGCLLALWCLLNLLRPDRRGLNLALSGAFCIAPYAAAWSNWPLYATMFPVLAFLTLNTLLRTVGVFKGTLLGLILGWLATCWVLVLYPPWLIILGTILGFLSVGWFVDQRVHLRFGWPQVGGLVLAGVVMLSLMGSWWVDTKDAVALIQSTEYPGSRGTLTGGDMSWWWHLRGYHNAETVAALPGWSTNQSEVSSYFYLPLLWLAMGVMNWRQAAGRKFALLGCVLFVACYWFFSLVGVSAEMARYTLWGHMPTGRMELGMGLASTIFFALLSNSKKQDSWMGAIAWPALVALANASLILMVINNTPEALLPASDWLFATTMAVVGAIVCWWMLRGRVGSAVAMLFAAHLIATLHFNPIVRAPGSVRLAEGHRTFVAGADGENGFRKTLVIDDVGTSALAFAAVGVPVVNGVLYYPHAEFWRRMRLTEADWEVVNRYQHLTFVLDVKEDTSRGYRVTSPVLDHVNVHVHPQRFDFSLTGAERVATLASDALLLQTNDSLRWLGQFQGIHWFEVPAAGSPKRGS